MINRVIISFCLLFGGTLSKSSALHVRRARINHTWDLSLHSRASKRGKMELVKVSLTNQKPYLEEQKTLTSALRTILCDYIHLIINVLLFKNGITKHELLFGDHSLYAI